jgi:hypothetical protein
LGTLIIWIQVNDKSDLSLAWSQFQRGAEELKGLDPPAQPIDVYIIYISYIYIQYMYLDMRIGIKMVKKGREWLFFCKKISF